MAKVECEIEEVELENEHGQEIVGIRAMCSDCGHETESFGTSNRSVRRCMALMAEECPEGERNYYIAPDYDGE